MTTAAAADWRRREDDHEDEEGGEREAGGGEGGDVPTLVVLTTSTQLYHDEHTRCAWWLVALVCSPFSRPQGGRQKSNPVQLAALNRQQHALALLAHLCSYSTSLW